MKHARTLIALAALVIVLVIGGSLTRIREALHRPHGIVWTPVTEQRLSHGRFDNFTVYVPHASPRRFVLLLSGIEGWNASMSTQARHLAEQGAMVAGLDVAQFNAALEGDGGQCVYPDGDLENLSHFVQAYFRLPNYLTPLLAGDAAGGTLAYATLAQAPKGTFGAAVSMSFCPSYPLNKPLCAGSGIEFTARPPGQGVDFLPSKLGGSSWTVLQSGAPQVCDVAAVQRFVAAVPGAQFIAVPGAGAAAPGAQSGAAGAPATTEAWDARYAATFDALLAQHPSGPVDTTPTVLADLPLVTVPPQPGTPTSDTFAIILSGDGGWAGLDKEVAGALAATGIPVIGLDSLRYFWSARTPAGLASDLDRITAYYSKQLGRQHVMLIGYSQGADVLPFAINHLNAATRSHISLTAIIGMSEHALFEFHMTSWIADDDSGPATLPEVERISGIPLLCIYGEGETDTLCPKLDPHEVTIVKLKGGHHFDGDYAGLARAILAARH